MSLSERITAGENVTLASETVKLPCKVLSRTTDTKADGRRIVHYLLEFSEVLPPAERPIQLAESEVHTESVTDGVT